MLITIGSITTATRAAKLIKRNIGAYAQVVATPSELNRGGCSYSVRFNDRYELEVRRLADEYEIPIKRIYKESQNGKKRVYHDIS